MTENLAYYPRRGYAETHRAEQDGFRRVFFRKHITWLPRAPEYPGQPDADGSAAERRHPGRTADELTAASAELALGGDPGASSGQPCRRGRTR